MNAEEAFALIAGGRPEHYTLPRIISGRVVRNPSIDEEAQWVADHVSIGGRRLTFDQAKEEVRRERSERRAEISQKQKAYDLLLNLVRVSNGQ